jgi:hypothetical protein
MNTILTEDTYRNYVVRAKVVVKEIQFEDYQSTGRFMNSRKMVFLVPVSGQMTAFFDAWLPEFSREEDAAKRAAGHLFHFNEVVGRIEHPIHGLARLAVMRGNERCEKHHLFMMSYGLSLLMIEQNLDGQEIEIEILPENADELADLASKGDDLLPFEKKKFWENDEEEAPAEIE